MKKIKDLSKEAKEIVKANDWNVWVGETDIKGTYALKGYDKYKLFNYCRINNIPLWN